MKWLWVALLVVAAFAAGFAGMLASFDAEGRGGRIVLALFAAGAICVVLALWLAVTFFTGA